VPRTYLPRHQRRQQILDATEALMVEHGVQSVTMARIAEAVGLTPGALYRHVRSRAEIVAAIVQRDLDELAELEADDFERYLGTEERRYLSEPDHARVRRELLYLASLDEAVGARVQAYERDLVARLGTALEVEVRAAQVILDGLSMQVDRAGAVDPRTDAAVRLLLRLLADAAAPPPTGGAGPTDAESARPERPSSDDPGRRA
jgi:AcrR family transcriptional regulator